MQVSFIYYSEAGPSFFGNVSWAGGQAGELILTYRPDTLL